MHPSQLHDHGHGRPQSQSQSQSQSQAGLGRLGRLGLGRIQPSESCQSYSKPDRVSVPSSLPLEESYVFTQLNQSLSISQFPSFSESEPFVYVGSQPNSLKPSQRLQRVQRLQALVDTVLARNDADGPLDSPTLVFCDACADHAGDSLDTQVGALQRQFQAFNMEHHKLQQRFSSATKEGEGELGDSVAYLMDPSRMHLPSLEDAVHGLRTEVTHMEAELREAQRQSTEANRLSESLTARRSAALGDVSTLRHNAVTSTAELERWLQIIEAGNTELASSNILTANKTNSQLHDPAADIVHLSLELAAFVSIRRSQQPMRSTSSSSSVRCYYCVDDCRVSFQAVPMDNLSWTEVNRAWTQLGTALLAIRNRFDLPEIVAHSCQCEYVQEERTQKMGGTITTVTQAVDHRYEVRLVPLRGRLMIALRCTQFITTHSDRKPAATAVKEEYFHHLFAEGRSLTDDNGFVSVSSSNHNSNADCKNSSQTVFPQEYDLMPAISSDSDLGCVSLGYVNALSMLVMFAADTIVAVHGDTFVLPEPLRDLLSEARNPQRPWRVAIPTAASPSASSGNHKTKAKSSKAVVAALSDDYDAPTGIEVEGSFAWQQSKMVSSSSDERFGDIFVASGALLRHSWDRDVIPAMMEALLQ